jgi:hypothetical protein
MSKYPRVIILVTLICKPYTKLSIENNKNNNKFLVNCKHRFFVLEFVIWKNWWMSPQKILVEVILRTKIKFLKVWSKKITNCVLALWIGIIFHNLGSTLLHTTNDKYIDLILWKIKFHLNANIEWHCRHLEIELNWIKFHISFN